MKVIGIHTRDELIRSFTLVDNFPPSVVINGTKFMVHYAPKMIPDPRSVTGYALNCDYLLDLHHDTVDPFPLRSLLGNEYIELKYENKMTQLIRCHRTKVRERLDTIEVNVPIDRLLEDNCDRRLTAIATPADRFMIKPNIGASSARQLVLPAHYYDAFHQNWNAQSINSHCENFPGAFASSTSGSKEDGVQLSDDSIVVPFIPDIEMEYRLLVGGDTMLVYQRSLTNKDGYSRVCTSDEEKLSGDEIVLESIEKTAFFSEQEKIDLRKLTIGTGFNYGSYDLYRTRTGKLGVFEYSPNFGFVGIHLADLNILSMSFFESLFK